MPPFAATVASPLAASLATPVGASDRGRGDRQADDALVDAIRRGAPGSEEALYHRYKRRVFALALRIVGVTDAEEVAQEAFIRIFRGLGRFRGDAALSTWVYRLTVNAALSHKTRRPRTERDVADVDLESLPAGDAPGGDVVLRARLSRALERLPPGYRTVVVLHDVEGLEHDEIARILGCHPGTSKSQLHKARSRLREILGAEGIGGDRGKDR